MRSVDHSIARATQPLLRVSGLSKTFPGLRALCDVDFAVRAGEIVALVGQNGSGKSTLVKILTGIHQADPGGRIEGPAHDDGGSIHVIHQDLGLVPQLNTVENLDLGRRYGARGALPTRPREEAEHARDLLRQFDAAFDVTGNQQKVVLAKWLRGIVSAEITSRDLTEERLVMESLGLRPPSTSAPTTETPSYD